MVITLRCVNELATEATWIRAAARIARRVVRTDDRTANVRAPGAAWVAAAEDVTSRCGTARLAHTDATAAIATAQRVAPETVKLPGNRIVAKIAFKECLRAINFCGQLFGLLLGLKLWLALRRPRQREATVARQIQNNHGRSLRRDHHTPFDYSDADAVVLDSKSHNDPRNDPALAILGPRKTPKVTASFRRSVPEIVRPSLTEHVATLGASNSVALRRLPECDKTRRAADLFAVLFEVARVRRRYRSRARQHLGEGHTDGPRRTQQTACRPSPRVALQPIAYSVDESTHILGMERPVNADNPYLTRSYAAGSARDLLERQEHAAHIVQVDIPVVVEIGTRNTFRRGGLLGTVRARHHGRQVVEAHHAVPRPNNLVLELTLRDRVPVAQRTPPHVQPVSRGRKRPRTRDYCMMMTTLKLL